LGRELVAVSHSSLPSRRTDKALREEVTVRDKTAGTEKKSRRLLGRKRKKEDQRGTDTRMY